MMHLCATVLFLSIYFMATSFDMTSGDSAISLHSLTQSVDTIVPFKHAATSTTMEEFSIAVTIKKCCQSMRCYETYSLTHHAPSHHWTLRTHPPCKTALAGILGHTNIDGKARKRTLSRELFPGVSMLWPSLYHPKIPKVLDRQAC